MGTINTTQTIGTDSIVLFQAVTPIEEISITNTGATIIYLGIGDEAHIGSGSVLYPTATYNNPINVRIAEGINAVSSAAGGTIAIFARI